MGDSRKWKTHSSSDGEFNNTDGNWLQTAAIRKSLISNQKWEQAMVRVLTGELGGGGRTPSRQL
jgi:hypothetical protein